MDTWQVIVPSTSVSMRTTGHHNRLRTSFLLYALVSLVNILVCWANNVADEERLPPLTKNTANYPPTPTPPLNSSEPFTNESQHLFQSSISCGHSEFYVQLTFRTPFKGLLYAYRSIPQEETIPNLNYQVQILDTCTLRGNGASVVYLELSFLSECIEKLTSLVELENSEPEFLSSPTPNTTTTPSTSVNETNDKFNLDGFNFRRALDHSHSVNISSDQIYQLSLYIQSDPNIEQKTDSKVTIQCSSQVTKNIIFEKNLSTDYSRKVDAAKMAKRRAIAMSTKLLIGDYPALLNETLSDEISARMDIFRGKVPFVKIIDKHAEPIELGDDLTAIIRVNKRDGFDWRVSHCFAHNTNGTSRRELTNAHGCAVEGSPMPAFKVLNQAGTESQVHYTSFSAFKFTGSSDLQIECLLQLCHKHCTEAGPDKNHNHFSYKMHGHIWDYHFYSGNGQCEEWLEKLYVVSS